MNKSIYGSCCRHGVFEYFFPLRKRQIAGEHDAASFIAIRQESEENLHFFTALLYIPNIIDEQGIVLGELFKHPGKNQIPLGNQQFLHEQATGCKKDPFINVNQLLRYGTEQMSFAATGIAKSQYVFASIDE
jgi:hypothetical protein